MTVIKLDTEMPDKAVAEQWARIAGALVKRIPSDDPQIVREILGELRERFDRWVSVLGPFTIHFDDPAFSDDALRRVTQTAMEAVSRGIQEQLHEKFGLALVAEFIEILDARGMLPLKTPPPQTP